MFTQPTLGNILIVDDDNSLVEFLCLNLKGEGYRVNSHRISQPIGKAALEGINLIIIDGNNNPDVEIGLISQIKASAQGAAVGIIYCSDFSDEYSLIDALDAGADDCVRKPFSLRELLARIRAIIRRRAISKPSKATSVLQFKSLALDTAHKMVTINREPLSLTNTEFAILALLMQNIGSFISRKEILDKVWHNDKATNDRIVDTNISRIRRKLGTLSGHLINRPNQGYTLAE